MANALKSIEPQIIAELTAHGATELQDRAELMGGAIVAMAQELFCDLVGAMLMGPAFYLSLYELGWGSTKSISTIQLAPDDDNIRAYPSFHYRLDCISRYARITDFCTAAKLAFGNLDASLRPLADCLNSVPTVHATDKVCVRDDSDGHAKPIEHVFNSMIGPIKTALDAFLASCHAALPQWFPGAFMPLSAGDVAALMERIQYSILPNIIPTTDHPLLGRPADFMSILNACALYRQHILATHTATQFEELCKASSRLERLTGKAFEVSFIQHDFNKWSEANNGRTK